MNSLVLPMQAITVRLSLSAKEGGGEAAKAVKITHAKAAAMKARSFDERIAGTYY